MVSTDDITGGVVGAEFLFNLIGDGKFIELLLIFFLAAFFPVRNDDILTAAADFDPDSRALFELGTDCGILPDDSPSAALSL